MTLRAPANAFLGWIFGICLSVLFVSLWGRAVVIDTDELGQSLAPLAASESVLDFVAGWMSDEFVDSGVDPALVEPTIDYFLRSSSVGNALDHFVTEVVDAAATSDPGGSSIDMRGLAAPAVPDMAAGLTALGYEVGSSDVREIVEDFDPLVIRQPGSAALVGPNSSAAARLGTASLVAAIGLMLTGSAIVRLSEDRIRAVRALLNRVAVGGLSFAVFLRLGAWVVDPGGGRAPVPETVANLAESKWVFPLQIAVVAALLGAAVYITRRYLKREAVSRSAHGPAKPRPERSESLSGSR